jgi:hypothetical protein
MQARVKAGWIDESALAQPEADAEAETAEAAEQA